MFDVVEIQTHRLIHSNKNGWQMPTHFIFIGWLGVYSVAGRIPHQGDRLLAGCWRKCSTGCEGKPLLLDACSVCMKLSFFKEVAAECKKESICPPFNMALGSK
mmetsp:Transcript_10181/g.62086  ORF Transcript_10181/g.62086 Transcript_10181/m.62086 type:complete len:103 (+) Transcript_10181:1448-1756(+)